MEKQIPNNVEAERVILGSILIDPAIIAQVDLLPNDFYRDAHRTIFLAMLSLANAHKEPNYLSVADELERMNKLEEVGGAFVLNEMISEVPIYVNTGQYVKMVQESAELRQLIHAAQQIAAAGYERRPDARALAEGLIFAIGQRRSDHEFLSMPEMVSSYMAELTDLQSRPGLTGVPSGYRRLDVMTAGFQKSDVIIVGARPSMGKTAFGLSLALNAALTGKKVAIFSLEMSAQSLMRRFIAMKSLVDLQRLRTGWVEDHEWGQIEAASTDLNQLGIYINDTSGNPVRSMRSQLKRLIARSGAIDMVVVDYLGLIGPSSEKPDYNRVQEVSKISRDLKGLAREFDIPFIVLSQLNREVEKQGDKRPKLSDLRDSGSIEQDADVVMFLYREDYYTSQEAQEENTTPKKPDIAEVIVAKQRNGPVGVVKLLFKKEHGVFYNLES